MYHTVTCRIDNTTNSLSIFHSRSNWTTDLTLPCTLVTSSFFSKWYLIQWVTCARALKSSFNVPYIYFLCHIEFIAKSVGFSFTYIWRSVHAAWLLPLRSRPLPLLAKMALELVFLLNSRALPIYSPQNRKIFWKVLCLRYFGGSLLWLGKHPNIPVTDSGPHITSLLLNSLTWPAVFPAYCLALWFNHMGLSPRSSDF